MGFFEDGYLEAVVRGAGSDWQQKFYNCDTFEMSCTSEPFSQAKPASPNLIAKTEAASSVDLPKNSQQISSCAALAKNVKAERTDLLEIFDSCLLQSSPFVLESAPDSPASIYCSSTRGVKKEAVEVNREGVVYGVHAGNPSLSSCSQLTSELKTALTPQQQLSGEIISAPVHAVTLSVSSSEVISGSTTTWTSPESQANELAKRSEPNLPPKETSSHSLVDFPTSKQQGSKRRKGQQKRVVCVPIAGTGRSSAEILPSDMWAWRKYGQKPIKGSPYPRGYYRCSSSKGCSARKQVERSRNDPSMLVITYTSEHNHAWPAHRNSLAGTTRTKSLDKLRSNNIEENVATAAPIESTELGDTSAASMSSCAETAQKQDTSPSPSPLEEYVPSTEDFVLMDDPQMMLDNSSITTMSSSNDHQLFQDLETLPELSTIIGERFFYYRSDDEAGINNMTIDPFDIFCWSSASTSSLMGSKIFG